MFTAAVACGVRTRLDSKEGISFTEFIYQFLQALTSRSFIDRWDVPSKLAGLINGETS